MKPEFKMLVRCCGIARNIPQKRELAFAQLSSDFDQGLFVRLAYQHKMTTAAHMGLKKLGLALQPENAGRLRQCVLKGRMLRELILEEASAITHAADRAGMSVLVLKGPASSLQLYGDALEREFTDLDLLVNLPTIDEALPFMAACGWEPENNRSAGNIALPPSIVIVRSHHVVFWRKGCPFRVELHDRTGWERELFIRDNIDGVFSRAVRLEQHGKIFFAPALPDHAVLIIAHGTQHAWALLHWLTDAAAIFNGASLNLERKIELHNAIASRICSLDMQRQLKLAYTLARRLFVVDLTPALELAVMGQASLDKSIAFAFARLQAGAADMSTFRNMIAFRLAYAPPLFPRAKGKLLSAFMLFQIPPKDAEVLPLPRPLLFFHFFLRPFFVLSRRAKRYRERKAGTHG